MTERHRFRFYVVTAAVVIAVIGVGCLRYYSHLRKQVALPDRARKAGLPIPVRTAQAVQGPVTTLVGATCVTTPSEVMPVKINPTPRIKQLNLIVREVKVRNGDHVTAGAPLLVLDTVDFERDIAKQRQLVAAHEAELAAAQAAQKENANTRQVEVDTVKSELEFRVKDVAYRKADMDRISEFYNTSRASLHEYLEAASAYSEAQFQLYMAKQREAKAAAAMTLGPIQDAQAVASATAALEEAKADLAVAEADLQRCRPAATLDGYVDKLAVLPDQEINGGDVLLEVVKLDPLWVRVDFPQERIGDLSLGQLAEVTLDANPKDVLRGRVVSIPPRVDESKRVLPVIVEVPNPDGRIKSGLSGYARIEVTRNVTWIPSVGVTDINAQAMVFVVEDDRAQMRSIRTGPILQTGEVEVIEGVQAGEEVVVFGHQYLNDGETVNTNWAEWTGRDN